MLDELAVENLAILADASIEPGHGLVVVTGETGTGKTLLLGALRLLTGASARREMVGPAGDETRVEARFILDGTEHVAARRVSAEGRSRAYLNGSMTTATNLGEVMGSHVEIVGQHDHLALRTGAGIRAMVDGTLDDEGLAAQAAYAAAWTDLEERRTEMALIGGDRGALERELDVVRFQVDEIASAGFEAGDDARLRAEAERLRHQELVLEGLSGAAAALGEEGAAGPLDAAAVHLQRAARHDPRLEPFLDQVEEVIQATSALARSVEDASDVEGREDRGRLDDVETRLALLGSLERKYGGSLDEMLSFGAGAAVRCGELEALLGRADGIGAALEAAERAVADAGAALTAARVDAARRLASTARDHLLDLGFVSPVVEFTFEPAPPGPAGTDRAGLRFASDEALPTGPVAKTASGGELSRLVLALRLASGVADAAVIAFDEIDAGVGGATARALGEKLASLAERSQVLCVTHLPQVAAFADRHFVVERDGPAATVRAVDGDDRVAEVSRMLAGLADSDKGRDHAAELLTVARSR